MDPELLARLATMEGQLRRLKLLTIVLFVATIGLVMAGSARSQQPSMPFHEQGTLQIPAKRLAANEFVLVGKDDKPYGRFHISDDGPALEFFDEKGKMIWSVPPAHRGYRPVQDSAR